jgi:hypothetical protein
MSKSKKKYLKEAIKAEQANNKMIRNTRKTTIHGLIMLSPIIAMFGVMVYGMTL